MSVSRQAVLMWKNRPQLLNNTWAITSSLLRADCKEPQRNFILTFATPKSRLNTSTRLNPRIPFTMAPTVLHLRSEDKFREERSALTPTTAKALIDAGYTVNVEKSPVRIFDDDEFSKIGCTLVPTGSWREVPAEHIIVGLKELPEETFPLKHVHVQFAHCYKVRAFQFSTGPYNQAGAAPLILWFPTLRVKVAGTQFFVDSLMVAVFF